jgi:hypothetical protein
MKPLALAIAVGLGSALGAVSASDAALSSVRAWQPTPQQVGDSHDPTLLMLRAGLFDPTREALDFPSSTLNDAIDGRYAVVQFHGTPSNAQDLLRAAGATVVGYVPNNAYVVRLGERGLSAFVGEARVRWVGGLRAGWKVDPALWPDVAQPSALTVELSIDGFSGESATRFAEALRKFVPETELVHIREDAVRPRLRVSVPTPRLQQAVEALARIEGVQWVAPYLEPRLMNDDSIGPMQANAATGTPIWDRDIIGTGQIVAISDSGLDRNESWFTRYDPGTGVINLMTDSSDTSPPAVGPVFTNRKIYAYWVQPGATAYDNNATCPGGSPVGFHGSHVSGTVAGDRLTTATPTEPAHDAGQDDGMAPNAQIMFQDIGNDTSGCLSGLGNLPGTIQQASAGGAKISSNSWGSSSAGAYGGSDVDVDSKTWELEDILFVVAAGNDGPGANSIGSPGNAKNAMTVGATGHGNSAAIAGFSSLGPTDDTRIKPDIVAPGSGIFSAAGNSNNGTTEQTGTSKSLSGTSMATPTISGSLALLRQYFDEGYYPRGAKTAADAYNPNGAMMKAMALNGSAILGTWPTNTFGWGRLFLENTLYFNSNVGGGGSGDARRMRFWEREHTAGLQTGEQHEYTLSSVGSGQELRVTLAWFDPEAGPGAAVTLVNNLDLEVVGPGGANTFKGNVFGAGVSVTGGTADARNTVEQVRLAAPTAGSYIVRVKGTALPGNGRPNSSRQGYAVVASGAFGVPDAPAHPAPGGLTIPSNNAAGVTVAFSSMAPNGHQLYRADGTCGTASPKEFRLVGTGSGTSINDDRTQGGYNYAYKVRGVSNDVEGNVSACIDALSNDTCTLQPNFNTAGVTRDFTNSSCQVQLDWAAGSSNCPLAPGMTYTVQRSGNPYFTTSTDLGSVSATTFVDSTVTGGTPYYYRVVPADGASNVGSASAIVNATPVGPAGPAGSGFLDDVDDNSYMNMQGVWRITNTQASTGIHSYHNAGDTGTYTADTCAAITTPPIQIPAGATLQYDARFDLELNWDGVIVEISTNGGATWADLPPTGGYPSTLSQTGNPPINACGYASTQGAYTGSSGGVFQAKSSSLAAFAGQTVQIRWRFTSDPGSEEAGFYLDNVRIPGVGPDPSLIMASGFEDGEGPTSCF